MSFLRLESNEFARNLKTFEIGLNFSIMFFTAGCFRYNKFHPNTCSTCTGTVARLQLKLDFAVADRDILHIVCDRTALDRIHTIFFYFCKRQSSKNIRKRN